MARSLFDPERTAGPPDPPKPGSDKPWSVAALSARITEALRTGLPKRLRVVGEISNLNNRTHWYFSLKDEEAVISCVMFASAARAMTHPPKHGDRVIATGRIEHYPKQGRTQLYVDKMEPVGAGALEAQLRELTDELRAAGYMDEERKRGFPLVPRNVAVITSATSAAYQDVLDTMRKRCPAVGVMLVDVRVQGQGNERGIARAVRTVSDLHERLQIDALIITRGGGSLEDLWCFNERVVADAIHACRLPVACAIGHETDTTIAELVADARCATPTQAAMRVSPDRDALGEQLDQAGNRFRAVMSFRTQQARREHQRAAQFFRSFSPVADSESELCRAAKQLFAAAGSRISQESSRLTRAENTLLRYRPEQTYGESARLIAAANRRLDRAMERRVLHARAATDQNRLARALRDDLEERRATLDALARELIVVSPESVLARGYSVTTTTEGRLVRSLNDAPTGTRLRTTVADGAVDSVVEGERTNASPTTTPELPPRRGRRKKQDAPGQIDLFGAEAPPEQDG